MSYSTTLGMARGGGGGARMGGGGGMRMGGPGTRMSAPGGGVRSNAPRMGGGGMRPNAPRMGHQGGPGHHHGHGHHGHGRWHGRRWRGGGPWGGWGGWPGWFGGYYYDYPLYAVSCEDRCDDQPTQAAYDNCLYWCRNWGTLGPY